MLRAEVQAAFLEMLQRELLPATGCTEPIAIAYGAAKMKQLLGRRPERVQVEVSGNILKNAKSVVVPNTGGLKGVKAAVAAGIIAGDPDAELQVISSVSEEKQEEIARFLQETPIQLFCPETPFLLDIRITGWAGEDQACVRIARQHTRIVFMEKNGVVQFEEEAMEGEGLEGEADEEERSWLTFENVYAFATEADLAPISALLERQLAYNTAIAEEGLRNSWGANIGSLLLETSETDIAVEARAWAAAGSDARMGGCEMPVVILSGSGNQGITASLPVDRYARQLGVRKDTRYRALLLSNLVTLYQKAGIGRLSAYCGVVSAGAGAGAGIAYLLGADAEAIKHTIANAVAILSGCICDGAKPSCAAKIAAAVEAGILGYRMHVRGQDFCAGDGIVGKDIDQTVAHVGVLAREGMRTTDRVILSIMTKSE